MHTKVVQYDFV